MESPKHIAILCHELSGNGKGAKIARETAEILKKKSVSHQLFINDWPEKTNGFSEIWIAGGDGTIHQYINHYHTSDIPVALLGGGTGNDLKNFLYGNLPLEKHVTKLLEPKLIKIDLGRCNERLYVNSLGIGFDGDVLQNMSSIRLIGGHLGYLVAVIKSIMTFREKRFRIHFHDEEKTIHPVILAISNSRLTGGGFIIAPKSSLQDGLLDLMYTDPMPWWKRLFVLPKVEKGKHLDLEEVYHYYVNEINISADQEVYYQIDGELLKAKEFRIRMDEKKLTLNAGTGENDIAKPLIFSH